MDSPAKVMMTLQDIETDLSNRQNDLEGYATGWFQDKRDKERVHAEIFLASEGTVAERNAKADLESSAIGSASEAKYEACKAVVRVLESRAGICQSLLRAQVNGSYR